MFGTSSALMSRDATGEEIQHSSDGNSVSPEDMDLLLERPYDPDTEFESNASGYRTSTRPHLEIPIPRQCVRDGAKSVARLLLAPFGSAVAQYHRQLMDQKRLANGLVVLLPGIDGCTTVSDSIARGLDLPHSPMAVEVHDWRSFTGWNPRHLSTYRQNRRRASQIAHRIIEYRSEFQGCPVHVVGHSAGAGMALFVLQALQEKAAVNTVTLLAAAVSRKFDVRSLSQRTENGIWNFWSRGDLPAAGIGTTIFGTIDRVRRPSAGAFGFCRCLPEKTSDCNSAGVTERFFDVGFQWEMMKYWNWGGHFGCTNTAFIKRYVAPIINEQVSSVSQLLDG